MQFLPSTIFSAIIIIILVQIKYFDADFSCMKNTHTLDISPSKTPNILIVQKKHTFTPVASKNFSCVIDDVKDKSHNWHRRTLFRFTTKIGEWRNVVSPGSEDANIRKTDRNNENYKPGGNIVSLILAIFVFQAWKCENI